MSYTIHTEVFTLRPDEWRVRIDHEVLPTVWNSKGAALAGLATECRRRGIPKDCWCKPDVQS
jgi:hypothetical protein